MGLPPKEKKFVAEYLIDHKGGPAAIRAGYSKRSADQIASRLLRKDKVAEAVAAGEKRLGDKLEIDAERIRKEIAFIAFVDLREAYTEEGKLKILKDMPEHITRALQAVDTEELFEFSSGSRSRIGNTIKVRFNDKLRALELLAKMLGYMKPEKLALTDKDGKDLPLAPRLDLSQLSLADLKSLAGKMRNGTEAAH
jgi:phage terminase small subunit